MIRAISFIAALSATTALTAVQPAQAQVSGSAGGGSAGNPGMQIATRGAANGVAACASCHGAQGEGNAAAGFPRIAGQSQIYLARQLASYANGSRSNPVMNPIAKGLTQEQINAVSAYYSGLDAPSSKPVQQPAANVMQRGRTLATVGDGSKGIQNCANCHGPGGVGLPPTYPYLANQHSAYLVAALDEWKSGARNTDPSQQMVMIAKRLNDADIAAVAGYYAAQPAPDTKRINVPLGSATRPVRPGASSGAQSGSGSQPAQGIGIEQGAPTTGGSQGPGGGGAASGSGPSGSPSGGTR
ncbi:MAG: hypothetical protein JWQ21_112 [Herminiimonas sp.]|nr:hypothetical protein [Herminiimonas sp.]